MKSSRFVELARSSVPTGKYSLLTEGHSSRDNSPRRRSKGPSTSAILAAKKKTSYGPSSSSSSSGPGVSSRSKCPTRSPRVYCQGCCHATAAAAEDSLVLGTRNSDAVRPCPSDYYLEQQATSFPSCLSSQCPWPNWPNCEPIRPSGQILPTDCSDSSSSGSLSDSESSELMWASTSSSCASRKVQEPNQWRGTCAFWENFVWGDRNSSWRKLPHHQSYVTNLWAFKREPKVKENCEPILVCVNVMGSPGPLRLVVNRNDSVRHTIDFALCIYAAQKRQPALVDPTPFFGLYCRSPDFEALDDNARIGDWSQGARQFHLYHKDGKDVAREDKNIGNAVSCRSNGALTLASTKSWIWDNLNGLQTWATNIVASVSHTVTKAIKYLNPGQIYQFIYTAAKQVFSLVYE